MAKILYLRSYFFPENTASSHLMNDLFEAFQVVGIETEVYCPTPTRGIDNKTREKYKNIKYEEMYDGTVKIHRFSMFREGRNPIMRAIRYILCNIIQYFKGYQAKNIDLILGASTPPTQGLLCALVKKKLKVPFIYNLQDIFPDSLVNTGLAKKGSILWKIGRKIEDYTYRNANKIIVISDGFKKNIMAKGVPEEKIEVIPNWVDTSDVYPVDRKDNILFDRYNINREKFIISYCGNIGHTQNMDMLLDAAKELQDRLPQLLFVLIGEGAEKLHVEERVSREKISNILILPFQPYEDIAHVFSLGDVGLIISKPGVGTNSVPSKTWSYMAAARPILVSFDENSEICNLIDEIKCGFISNNSSYKHFVKTVLQLLQFNALTKMGCNGLNYVKKNLNKDDCINKYIQLLNEC